MEVSVGFSYREREEIVFCCKKFSATFSPRQGRCFLSSVGRHFSPRLLVDSGQVAGNK